MGKLSFAALAAVVTSLSGALWTHAHTRAVEPALERWTRSDADALDARIEQLEERLLAHQARVSFWQEMRDRHAGVTAVACANLGDHAMAMKANESRFQVRLADQRKRRVASAAEITQ